MPLECDIDIAINGPFWVEVANPEHPFKAMLIARSRGTCLIADDEAKAQSVRDPERIFPYICCPGATMVQLFYLPFKHS